MDPHRLWGHGNSFAFNGMFPDANIPKSVLTTHECVIKQLYEYNATQMLEAEASEENE
jgi:hypothetical protein